MQYCSISELPTVKYEEFKKFGGMYRLWVPGLLPAVWIAEAKYVEVCVFRVAKQGCETNSVWNLLVYSSFVD